MWQIYTTVGSYLKFKIHTSASNTRLCPSIIDRYGIDLSSLSVTVLNSYWGYLCITRIKSGLHLSSCANINNSKTSQYIHVRVFVNYIHQHTSSTHIHRCNVFIL